MKINNTLKLSSNVQYKSKRQNSNNFDQVSFQRVSGYLGDVETLRDPVFHFVKLLKENTIDLNDAVINFNRTHPSLKITNDTYSHLLTFKFQDNAELKDRPTAEINYATYDVVFKYCGANLLAFKIDNTYA